MDELIYNIGHTEMRELRKAGFRYQTTIGKFGVYTSDGLNLYIIQTDVGYSVIPTTDSLDTIINKYNNIGRTIK